MLKLLNAYRANPTLENAQKIRAYSRKHPFSTCFADYDTLADAIHHANAGRKAAAALDDFNYVGSRHHY